MSSGLITEQDGIDTPLGSEMVPLFRFFNWVISHTNVVSDDASAQSAPPASNAVVARLVRLLEKPRARVEIADHWIDRSAGDRLRVRSYTPGPKAGLYPVLVHAHGGGFALGSPDDTDGHLSQLAKRANVVVVSVDYGLIPDHPYPDALNDMLSAVSWTHEQARRLSIDTDRLALGGGSAGGNLALATALAFPEHLAAPKLLLLEEPWLDISEIPAQPRAAQGFYAPFLAEHNRARDLYAGDIPPSDPRVSPGRALDVSGLPPTVLLGGDIDLLIPQHRSFLEKLRSQGVQASLYVFPGLLHGTSTLTRIGSAADYETVAITALRSELHLYETPLPLSPESDLTVD